MLIMGAKIGNWTLNDFQILFKEFHFPTGYESDTTLIPFST